MSYMQVRFKPSLGLHDLRNHWPHPISHITVPTAFLWSSAFLAPLGTLPLPPLLPSLLDLLLYAVFVYQVFLPQATLSLFVQTWDF